MRYLNADAEKGRGWPVPILLSVVFWKNHLALRLSNRVIAIRDLSSLGYEGCKGRRMAAGSVGADG